MVRLLLDDLTGAYQRAGLDELLGHLTGGYRSSGTHYALAMLDVDHLKTLNDVYGHATGDAALKAVAERSARVLRSGDKLFRYGGDEFLLVLPGTTLEEAESVARRVRDQVTANPVEAAVWVNVNISIGVAASDEQVEDLFGRADARLYLAKRAGRNMVVAHGMPLAGQSEELLRETRLVGRDEQLAHIDTFLTKTAASPEERVLKLTGPSGVGFTRLLDEIDVRATIAGRAVRRVRAAAADSGVYLRALARAYGERLPPDPAEEEVNEVLAYDAEGHGLVVLLEGGRWLDPGSRALLANRLRKGGARLVEVVPDGESELFSASRAVALTPLSVPQACDWLAAALGTAVDHETGEALARAGEGRPARIVRLVQGLAFRLAREGGATTAATFATGITTGATATSATTPSAPPTPPPARPATSTMAARVAAAPPSMVHELARAEATSELTVSLPQWSEPLVGRSHWLAGAAKAVSGARLSVLVGPGGVGKSRLAAQLARDLAHEYSGGTYWIDLRSVNSAAVVPGLIAQQLGLDHTEDLGQLARDLNDQPRLLVLDELDGMADQVGWVDTLLKAAPEVRVLATSRRPLRMVGERHIEVPELSGDSACELFRRGMEKGGGGERVSDEDLATLVEQVGANPLALELASAWTRSLRVAELRDRLRHHPEILIQAPGLAQRTVRFIDITRQLMSEWEQETLGTLALMPAGFSADVARSATDASPFYLLALLERSLIRREGERYTVHAAIAERYRAGLRRPDKARAHVVRALAGLAQNINEMDGAQRSGRGYRLTDVERANLVYALRAAVEQCDLQATWPLVTLLRGYHDVRGRAREGLELFGHALAALATSPDVELRGWVAETVALFEHQTGNSAAAEARLVNALKQLEALGPNKTTALALNTLGIIRAVSGRGEEGLAALAQSADMRARLGDVVGEAQARGNIAILSSGLGHHREAFAALESALSKYREVGHVTGVALSLVNLAELGRTQRLLAIEECTRLAKDALDAAEGIGYTTCASNAASELAWCLAAAGRKTEARAALERALDWARLSQDQVSETGLLERLRNLDP